MKVEKCPVTFRVSGYIYSSLPKHTKLLVGYAKKVIKGLKIANGNVRIKKVDLEWLEEPMKYGKEKP